ncbi:hypothetical protein QFC19_003634 [Naganishia cerealis]|uniref:Uncharacterized protein n=1 Tax=Naganishia cerealis TaxID=610337 RepID=A0ACC2W0B9_9TREE|nr:hypothetical protein QFC19_003634 [Naganishia cerealis]
MDEDDYSSSDTEVGDRDRIYDTSPAPKDSLGGSKVLSFSARPSEAQLRGKSFDSSDQERNASTPHQSPDLRASAFTGSTSTLLDQDMRKSHPTGSDDTPCRVAVKQRPGEAISRVTRNIS